MSRKAWIVLAIAVVWGIICWWWYVNKIKGSSKTESSAVLVNKPVIFHFSSDTPITGKSFQAFKDSIVTLVGKNGLEITGLYFADEKNNTSFPDLGKARASMAKNLFKDKLPDAKISISSQIDSTKYPAGKPDAFEGVTFTVITQTVSQPVEEHGNTIIIYMPTKTIDSTVSVYLKQLAGKLKSAKSHMTIVGYSDNKGPAKSNLKAGMKRAITIKNELVKDGMNAKKIIVKSGGDKNPIASNDTEEGRQKNKRVEITITNP